MKAARIHRFGSPEVIVIDEIDPPVPTPDEVLVRVEAAGVGPWDSWVRSGKSVLDHPLPLTLGADLSGTVISVGANVTTFRPGDEVFGVTNPRFTDASAEFACARAAMIARKPKSLSSVQAAAVPVVAVTALQMLFDHAHVSAGQRVLIHGAGGSVGSCAVQLAKLEGAHVIATARTHGIAALTKLGADQIVDVTTRFEDAISPVDVVIDTVGGEVQARSLSILKPGGVLISAVSPPKAEELTRLGVRGAFMLVEVNTASLTRIGALLDAGSLSVRVGNVLALAEARRAHLMLEGLEPREPGKIVLTVH